MNDEIWFQLRQPFSKGATKWRLGATNAKKVQGPATKGQPLCYVDARMVMDRLDTVVGPESWQDKYEETAKRIICSLGIKIENEWIWKADGAGDTDMEGEKGGLSDAFKRAAVKFGIGRYLYAVHVPWIDLDNGYIPKSWDGNQFLPEPSYFKSKQARTKYYKGLKEAAGDDDMGKARELWDELDEGQRLEIWHELSSGVRSAIKNLLDASGAKHGI